MYYHVRISQKSSSARDETKVDLSEEELRERYLKPYELGSPIIINGKTITSDEIERIRLSKSKQPSEHLIQQIRAEDRTSPVFVVGGPSVEWRAADRAEDITDKLIVGPPGYGETEEAAVPKESSSKSISPKKVFVVHGRDHELKNDVEVFLTEVGLEPIVLHRQPDGGLTVIEKFEENADVSYALVLLTPDDVLLEASDIDKPEAERNLLLRARQNVIFELGYFVAKLGRSNVSYIYKEGVELPSDLSGLIYKKVNKTIEEVGYALIKELRNAGLQPTIE